MQTRHVENWFMLLYMYMLHTARKVFSFFFSDWFGTFLNLFWGSRTKNITTITRLALEKNININQTLVYFKKQPQFSF